jgi:hypothetical protein
MPTGRPAAPIETLSIVAGDGGVVTDESLNTDDLADRLAGIVRAVVPE